jgi:transmembrane sensor
MTPRASIADQAASWVAAMDAGGWDDAREAELQKWLGEDPRHRGALLQAEAAWITLDRPSLPTDVAQPQPRLPIYRRRFLAGGVGLAASLAGGLLWWGGRARYATQVGEIRRVPLADGSVATINTDSVVDVRLAAAKREVWLESGEAWFQVAKDRHRPFIVKAGDVQVQAVGTAFSVRRFAHRAEILVTEGVVEAWTGSDTRRRVRLAAGERGFVGDDGAILPEQSGASSVDRALAWRAGKIELVGEQLGDAVQEFNRYNRRKLVLADPGLSKEQFDGVFGIDDPAGFAAALHAILAVPVDLSNPAVIRIGESPQEI